MTADMEVQQEVLLPAVVEVLLEVPGRKSLGSPGSPEEVQEVRRGAT